MADTEKTNKGTDYRETADSSKPEQQKAADKPEAPAYDPWDRERVDPADPRFVEANRNRVNSGDFGVVSSELRDAGDEPEKTTAPGEVPDNDTTKGKA